MSKAFLFAVLLLNLNAAPTFAGTMNSGGGNDRPMSQERVTIEPETYAERRQRQRIDRELEESPDRAGSYEQNLD